VSGGLSAVRCMRRVQLQVVNNVCHNRTWVGGPPAKAVIQVRHDDLRVCGGQQINR
jgi:hypothetical protein